MSRQSRPHRFPVLPMIGTAALFLLGLCGPASAQNAAPPAVHVPHTAVTPRVDGSPNDPAWNSEPLIPSLTLSLGPDAAGLKPQRTSINLAWDEKYLYLRYMCYDDHIDSKFRHHDDPIYAADAVELFIDPKGDQREWIEIEVSPNNVVFDQLAVLTADPVSGPDHVLLPDVLNRDWWMNLSWTLDGLRTATSRIKENGNVVGWVADLAVPADPLLRRLGKKSFEPMTLRANLLRYDYIKTAGTEKKQLVALNWAPVKYGCPHISPEAMGSIVLDR